MYNIDYLFRYRDLVADTLPEHRKVAEKIGYCWWGWWKRPNEPSHSDVWRRLKEQTADGKSVQIGLFHSGTGEVHLATINGVLEPVEDEYESLRPIMPPKEEIKAVPAYYRASSQSRAWLRIESISTTPHRFFGSHSFPRSAATSWPRKEPASSLYKQADHRPGRTAHNGHNYLACATNR